MPLWIGRKQDGSFEIGSSPTPWSAESGFVGGKNYLGEVKESAAEWWPLLRGTVVEIPDSLISVCPTCGRALKGGG